MRVLILFSKKDTERKNVCFDFIFEIKKVPNVKMRVLIFSTTFRLQHVEYIKIKR
jgi:hypothetical protein